MIFLLPLLTAPALQAPPPPPPFPLLHPSLGLDATQRTQIEAILARHRDSLHAKREAFEAKRQALRDALGDPARTRGELESLLAAEAAAHREQVLTAHAVLQEAAQVLRPEQREAAARLKPQEGRGPGFGRGEGPRGSRPERPGPDGRP